LPEAISNTSPLLYLYRIDALDWLPQMFSQIWVPNAVIHELQAGQTRGYDVPILQHYAWLQVVEPTALPSERLPLDLGSGELAAISLAIEHPFKVLLLDDALARRTAKARKLQVWGTLKILLEAKSQGLTESIAPLVDRLGNAGMWLSRDIRQRILDLAHEI
jgi:hypothetical protein